MKTIKRILQALEKIAWQLSSLEHTIYINTTTDETAIANATHCVLYGKSIEQKLISRLKLIPPELIPQPMRDMLIMLDRIGFTYAPDAASVIFAGMIDRQLRESRLKNADPHIPVPGPKDKYDTVLHGF